MTSATETVEGVVTESGLGEALDLVSAYIVRQRWSGAFGRTVSTVRIVDIARIEEIAVPTYFTVTRVRFDDGGERDYALPLGHRPVGDPLAERAPEFMIGSLPGADSARFLYDALGDPEYVRWLWRSLPSQATLRTAAASLRFQVFDAEALEPGLDPSLRLVGAEQSNTSFMLGERTFLKQLRRVEPGPSHELEMLDALRRAGFTHLAPLLGATLYEPPGAAPSPVVLVQPFLRNGTEGWTLALTSLRSLYAEAEELAQTSRAERRVAVDEHGGDFAPEAGRLGAVLAQMHVALTQPGLGADIDPKATTASDLRRWAAEMTAELDALLDRPDPALEPLRRSRDAVAARFAALQDVQPGGLCIRIHGDLHLGQTLRTDSGWIILDFEGEPDRTPAERRMRTSPLRDVAGMLRSFDYAAAVALAERLLPESADWEGMLAFGHAWSQVSRDAFWAAYLEGAAESGLLPEPGATHVLRQAFEMQKAVYETGYELGHRPTWTGIPLRFLLRGVE
jgi:maltokinase